MLGGSDSGLSYWDGKTDGTGAVGGKNLAGTQFQLFIPVTPASSWEVDRYGSIWSRIGGNGVKGAGFTKYINPSTSIYDNGMGVQWNLTGASSYTITAKWAFTANAASVTTPAISATPTALANFVSVQGTPSVKQTFSVSGLTANATVTAPTGYEVSLDGVTYAPAVTLANPGGTIHVRLTAGAAVGAALGNISIVSGTATQNVALTGKVYGPPVANPATNITTTSFIAQWTKETGITDYKLDVATDAGFTAFVTGYQDKSVGILGYSTVSGVSPSTTYYYRVRAVVPITPTAVTTGNSNVITVNTVTPCPTTTPNVTVGPNANGQLNATTADPNATYKWTPPDGLSDSKIPNPIVNVPASTTFYVTATKEDGTCSSINMIVVNVIQTPVAIAATGSGSAPIANWNSVPGATSYKLDLSTSPAFGSFVGSYHDYPVGNVTTFPFTGLDPTIPYYYRIAASDADGTGSYSNTITIKGTPVITWANPADIIYGTKLSATQLNASAVIPGAFVYTPAANTLLTVGNAQNLKVDFTPTDVANYNSATKTVVINVLKAPLTVTVDNKSMIYKGTIPAFTYAISGYVNNETVSVVTGTPAITTTATSTSDAGTYDITAALGTLTATNYSFTYAKGILTINKAPQTITATVNVFDKYVGDLFDPLATASSGLVVAYTVTQSTPIASVLGNKISVVGAGTATITVNQAGNNNYEAAPAITLTLKTKELIFSNFISPNDDGKNDFWGVPHADVLADAKIIVFNSYGQELFSTTGYTQTWDGTNNGKKCAVGEYYYQVKYSGGVKTGVILLMIKE